MGILNINYQLQFKRVRYGIQTKQLSRSLVIEEITILWLNGLKAKHNGELEDSGRVPH